MGKSAEACFRAPPRQDDRNLPTSAARAQQRAPRGEGAARGTERPQLSTAPPALVAASGPANAMTAESIAG